MTQQADLPRDFDNDPMSQRTMNERQRHANVRCSYYRYAIANAIGYKLMCI